MLFISYYYPPMGGAGVQRTVKFLKYLPEHDYAVTVIAGDESTRSVPGSDATLGADCPQARVEYVAPTRGERALKRLSRIHGAAWLPWISRDLGWWARGARRVGRQLIEAERPDVICVTASPFAVPEAGRFLSSRYGIPWILDLRDPWALDPIHTYPSYLQYAAARRAMRRACMAATAVIMNTPCAAEKLKDEFPEVTRDKVFCITNGYDSDDMPASRRAGGDRSGKPLRIVHSGLFVTDFGIKVDARTRRELGMGTGEVRLLDRMRYRPGEAHLLARTPYYLFKSIRLLMDQGRLGEPGIKCTFVGHANRDDRALAERFGLEQRVEWRGYLPHREAVECLAEADVLFLPLHTVKPGMTPLIVPGKTYEYIGLRKPILACVPEGDARDILAGSGLARVCEPTDAAEIAGALEGYLDEHRRGGITVRPNEEFIAKFERRRLTEELVRVCEFAVTHYGSAARRPQEGR